MDIEAGRAKKPCCLGGRREECGHMTLEGVVAIFGLEAKTLIQARAHQFRPAAVREVTLFQAVVHCPRLVLDRKRRRQKYDHRRGHFSQEFDGLASSAAGSRPAMEEERYVRAQARANLRQPRTVEPEAPKPVEAKQD